jgi:hypothetical protein
VFLLISLFVLTAIYYGGNNLGIKSGKSFTHTVAESILVLWILSEACILVLEVLMAIGLENIHGHLPHEEMTLTYLGSWN